MGGIPARRSAAGAPAGHERMLQGDVQCQAKIGWVCRSVRASGSAWGIRLATRAARVRGSPRTRRRGRLRPRRPHARRSWRPARSEASCPATYRVTADIR